MSVPDGKIIEILTAGGHAVADYFLIGEEFLAEIRGGLHWPSVDDPVLAAAVTAYLRRNGAAEYASSPAYYCAVRVRLGLPHGKRTVS